MRSKKTISLAVGSGNSLRTSVETPEPDSLRTPLSSPTNDSRQVNSNNQDIFKTYASEEPFVYDSRLKQAISEEVTEHYFKSVKGLFYTCQEPFGINHRNTDFTVNQSIHVEVKNVLEPAGIAWLFERILAKFLDDDPEHKGVWVLIIPRVTDEARRWLKSINVKLILTEKQLVFPSQYKRYTAKKRLHATTSPAIWLRKLSCFFNPRKNKDSSRRVSGVRVSEYKEEGISRLSFNYSLSSSRVSEYNYIEEGVSSCLHEFFMFVEKIDGLIRWWELLEYCL